MILTFMNSGTPVEGVPLRLEFSTEAVFHPGLCQSLHRVPSEIYGRQAAMQGQNASANRLISE